MKELKNYKIIESRHIEELNSQVTFLEHIKTKASVLVFENDDNNKVFGIGFKTVPQNSTGVPHIIEHSVLCGSDKYPVKEPFVELLKSSLNTFLNAMTYPDKTVYPVASCNEKDFENLMDVYMDAVCHPNIYKKQEIFKQEGWHYELENKDAELTINGVVYNEMKGAFSSPDSVLFRQILHSLFPSNTYGVESGGDPDVIPELTYEDFIAFHKEYYHPSNSYICLYGNMNAEKHLTYLDEEYLSKYEAIEPNSHIEEEKPFKEMVKSEMVYPIGQDQTEDNKAYLAYNVVCGKVSDVNLGVTLEILQDVLLNASGAPLKQAILDAGIGNDVNSSYESEVLQPIFSIVTKNTNPDKADEFINLIENTIKEIIEKGIDKKSLMSTINYYEFKYRESDFGRTPKGLVYYLNSLGTWLYDKSNPFGKLEMSKAFAFLKEQLNTDYFEKVLEEVFLNNTHKSLVILKPSKTISLEKEQALKEKLAAYKASLTDVEIEQIVEDTKALKAYQSKVDSPEDLATIPTLSREDIGKEADKTKLEEKKILNNVSLHENIFTNGIGYLKLLFNVKNLPAELLPYASLYRALFGKVDTANYQYRELEEEIKLNSGGIFAGIGTAGREALCHLTISASVLYEKLDFAFNMIEEIMYTSKFDNQKRVKEILDSIYSMLQRKMVGAGHGVALTRALSYQNEKAYLDDLFDGVAFYDFVKDLVENYETKKDEIKANLEKVVELLYTKENLTIAFAADEDGYNQMEEYAVKFIEKLADKYENTNPFKFVPNKLNEGLKAPVDVQFVAQTGNFEAAGLKYHGAAKVLSNIIGLDYLWLEGRVKGGAYGCFGAISMTGNVYFVSYRDPNLENTLNVYANIPAYIDSLEFDEDALFKFIIGSIGELDQPNTPKTKFAVDLNLWQANITDEQVQEERDQVINCTLEEVKAQKALIEAVLKQNYICVVGNENRIDKVEGIFTTKRSLL